MSCFVVDVAAFEKVVGFFFVNQYFVYVRLDLCE